MASILENICLILAAIICCPFVCLLYICGCGHLFKNDDDDAVDIERVTTGNVNRAAVIPERQVGTGKFLEFPESIQFLFVDNLKSFFF